VISLQQAKKHLTGEVKYKYPVVLTIDDGWHQSVVDMIPLILQYKFASTLYVTTHYVSHQIPVTHVFMQYILWKSGVSEFKICFNGHEHHYQGSTQEILEQVDEFLRDKSDADKISFLSNAARTLEIGPDKIKLKLFQSATFSELDKINQSPLINLQLHTHRHQLPLEPEKLREEIEKNRRLMKQSLGHSYKFNEFCYPSGIWHIEQLPLLQELGIKSATTLDEGMNRIGDDLLKLKRYLIMDNRSLEELKLTLSGGMGFLRKLRK
jgi:peptidoglycan/xylan/chitin deacetylase (PgdA/CDA1 family)